MCCFECGPQNSSVLEAGTVRGIIDQLADIGIKDVGLSGGECMLYKDLVISIAEYAREKGLKCSVATNGFWASDYGRCMETLEELRGAGIRNISVSVDDCHLKYVPMQCIKNILKAAPGMGVELQLDIGDSLSGRRAADIISELGGDAYRHSLAIYPFAPIGRGEGIPGGQLVLMPYEKDWKCCYSRYLSIMYDGTVHPCCSQAVYKSGLSYGNIHQSSLAQIIDSYENEGLFSTLLRQGLDFFVRIAGEAGFRLPEAYVSPCHLCNVLFKDKKFVELAKPYAMREYLEHAKKRVLDRYKNNAGKEVNGDE